MKTLQLISIILTIAVSTFCLFMLIRILINDIKLKKEAKKFDDEFYNKLLKDQLDRKIKLDNYEYSLRQIRLELAKNQNGSAENLASNIKKMIPKELL